ncbi:MAG TPA: CopG family transcriptional regulator [Verrucomicrobiae bacterium]|nr:CopG family transcriptional regulator [Verrucomicrobiae bacterium]
MITETGARSESKGDGCSAMARPRVSVDRDDPGCRELTGARMVRAGVDRTQPLKIRVGQIEAGSTGSMNMMYVSYIMKRTQIYLDVDQDRRLARRATAVGTSKSTLIREAIESYLSSADDDAGRLKRFRAALDGVKQAPVKLESGRDYVERMRAVDEERREERERPRR